MYQRIKMMEERIPMTPRPAAPARPSGTLDEGSLDLLEHLISTVLQGNSTYLQALLQHEDILDVLDLQDNKGFTALHIAGERTDPNAVRLLLGAGANPNVPDRFGRTALHWTVSGGCHCDFCNTKRARCAEFLLEAKANVEAEELNGETPLTYAAKHMFHKAATVMLEHGADISKTSNGVNTGHLLVQKIPEVMLQLLDASIAYDTEDNSKLKVDFGILIESSINEDKEDSKKPVADGGEVQIRPKPKTKSEQKLRRETDLLSVMLRAHPIGREALLTHPVTEAFLHLKWLHVRKWFWFVRFFYSAITIVYSYFVFNLYIISCPYQTPENKAETCEPILEMFILAVCIGSGLGIMVLNEFYELCHDFKYYFRSGVNLGWWLLIGGISLTLLPAFGLELWDWQYPVAAFSLFYSWAMNLAHIGRIPYFGAYVEMLGKVLQKVAIVCFTYFSLFVAFVLGFCVLFPKSSFFEGIPKSMLKVFLMMMGDRDYAAIFQANDEPRLTLLEYSIPVHVFYVAFIIIFGIVIMNLLMALAVSDIQELRKSAELARVASQITEISILESFISSNCISSCLTNCVLSRLSVKSRNGRYFRFSPTDPEDKSLPSDLKQKFIPFLNTRPCLNKKQMLRPMLAKSRTPSGSAHGPTSHYRGLNNNAGDSLDDILNDLRRRLETLQR